MWSFPDQWKIAGQENFFSSKAFFRSAPYAILNSGCFAELYCGNYTNFVWVQNSMVPAGCMFKFDVGVKSNYYGTLNQKQFSSACKIYYFCYNENRDKIIIRGRTMIQIKPVSGFRNKYCPYYLWRTAHKVIIGTNNWILIFLQASIRNDRCFLYAIFRKEWIIYGIFKERAAIQALDMLKFPVPKLEYENVTLLFVFSMFG